MSEKSIELLNRSIADELTAVHQYMYFHFHCDDQGFDLLAKLFLRTAIEEMHHIEVLAERAIFLGGDADMDHAQPIKIIHDVREMLKHARDMEASSARDYNLFANESSANADAVTKQVFEKLVADEERHGDQFEVEMTNIDKFGDRYLALQSMERSRSIASGAPAVD